MKVGGEPGDEASSYIKCAFHIKYVKTRLAHIACACMVNEGAMGEWV